MRTLKYVEALHAAILHAMKTDPSVFVMGIGVDDHKAAFGSTAGLLEKFGPERVFDTPISEAAMTGISIGAALGGMKPVHVHIRSDFLYLAMDQLLNIAAKWRAMFGGQMSVPIVVRAAIGRSWGQGAQHSQSLQAMFMHVPGIKVAMPTTPGDAHDLLLAAIADPNPVILFEHRLLYGLSGEVPASSVKVPFRRAVVRRQGKDLTIVANSYMVIEALRAAEILARQGIEVEIVDPVTLVPLEEEVILESVRKTGRLLALDAGWVSCGVSAEIAALVSEKAFGFLKGPVVRLGMQAVTCPVSKPLESLFYPDALAIVSAIAGMLGRRLSEPTGPVSGDAFKGPF